MSMRQRDVFPIPMIPTHNFVYKDVSHSTRKRLNRKNKIVEWANEGLDVLNVVGTDELHSSPTQPSLASSMAREQIHAAYAALPPPPEGLSREGALSELLASGGFYSENRTDIQPHAKDRVSWPASGSKAVSLLNGVCPADRKLLHNWGSYMLRSNDDYHHHIAKNPKIKPYVDPQLSGNPSIYADFLTRLHDAGMLRFRKAQESSGALGAS